MMLFGKLMNMMVWSPWKNRIEAGVEIMNEVKPIIIKAIKTEVCYFIQEWNDARYGEYSGLDSYFFDGLKPEPTHHKAWVKIKSLPTKMEKKLGQPNINFRYELIEKNMACDKFPLVYQREDVARLSDEHNHWVWKPEFRHLYSLYEEKYDKQPDILVSIPFEFNVICEIDNIKEYAGFAYKAQKTRWDSDGHLNITPTSVKYQVIDKIVFPDIVLPSKPSSLDSHDSYKIIRQYIKDNINPKYAKITSDYDFCFTVEKRIELPEPVPYQVNISGTKRPKYVTNYRTNRNVKVFEMTYSGHGGNYNGYTPIKGFEGKNHEDLKKNIDKYLSDLITKINQPIADCKHCKGSGVIIESESKKV
jgi:hypothetical protein